MNPALDLGLALLCAHLVGDFIAQTDGMAGGKRKPAILAMHAAIQAAIAYVLAGRWGLWPAPWRSTRSGVDGRPRPER